MPAPGHTSLSLQDDLVAAIDRFVKSNDLGFTSRNDVLRFAVRDFLQRQAERRAVEERSKAVARDADDYMKERSF